MKNKKIRGVTKYNQARIMTRGINYVFPTTDMETAVKLRLEMRSRKKDINFEEWFVKTYLEIVEAQVRSVIACKVTKKEKS